MATKEFVARTGLHVTSNIGVGTSTITTGTRVMVRDGNVNISSNGYGLVFPDGTFQTTASTAAGGTGAIQYASGTAFAGDNTKLYFDGTNSRVGIGTSDTANATLHVKGSVPTLLSTLNGTDYETIIGNNISYGSTVGWSPSSNMGYLKLVAGANMINWNSAGVGINNVTPINTLDVSGRVVIGSGLAYAGTATAPSNGLLVQGSVGIGTTTADAAKFEVYDSSSSSTLQITGDSVGANLVAQRFDNNATGTFMSFRKSRGSRASPLAVNNGDVAGTISLQAYAGSNNRSIATIVGVVDTLVSDTNISGFLTFNTNGGSTGVTERMRITADGNVGIATSTVTAGYRLEVNGGLAATTKSFVINHPTKPGMKLRYGSLEGAENGVYYRGRTQSRIIQLPDYWTKLVDESSITVNFTAIGKKQDLYVKEIADNQIVIGGSRSIDCYYTVFAERKDVEKLIVEF